MSYAWETTTEDVRRVLDNMQEGADLTDEQVDEIHTRLDHDAIEKAALYGDDMLEQCDYADKEIEEQIFDGDLIAEVSKA